MTFGFSREVDVVDHLHIVTGVSLSERLVHAEKKAVAIERELMILRRRASEREAAFDQQRLDASELSVQVSLQYPLMQHLHSP